MRDDHIIKMLEQNPLGSLSEGEIASIEFHIAHCSGCRRAYEAARISAALIRARTSEAIDVAPFFKTRVMAAVRERQLSPEVPTLIRMWRAAGGLVSAMAAVAVVLIGLTVWGYSPGWQTESPALADTPDIYSAEYVVFDQGDPAGDAIAYEQVLTTIYDSGEADDQ